MTDVSDNDPVRNSEGAAYPIPESVDVLDASVTPLQSYDQACQVIRHAIDRRAITTCVAINPEKVYQASRDSDIRAFLNDAQLKICDGIGVVLAVKLLHGKTIPRITGIGLFESLVKYGSSSGWRIFLLGASESVSISAANTLCQQYPALKIVGRCHGYFANDAEVIRQINATRADVLFVALGSPRQEHWLAEHADRIEAPFRMGIGGTLDVVSGKTQRAPRLFRAMGAEWLYRLVAQPARYRRQMVLPWFVVRTLRRRFGRADRQS